VIAMKKTQIKDALRNIRRERVSYFSILLIAFMAVTCYVGVVAAETALLRSGNRFYDETSFHDLEIASTLLLEEGDVEAIRAVSGVLDAEGVYLTTAKAFDGTSRAQVSVRSLTERIDLPILTEGHLPAAANECAVEERFLAETDFSVGDTVRLTSGDGGVPDYLANEAYVITGSFLHSEHICDTVTGNALILVTPEAFDLDRLDGCYMKAEVLLDKAAYPDRYGDEYKEALESMRLTLESLAAERAAMRDESVHTRYQSEIDENQAKLDDAAARLAEARTQLDEGVAQLEENRQKLADAERELAESRAELDQGSEELSGAKTQLDRIKRTLSDAAKELADGKSILDDTAAQLADAAAQLADGKALLNEKAEELAQGRLKLDNAKQELAEAKAKLEDAAAEIAENRQKLVDAEQKLADGWKELEENKKLLDAAAEELKSAETQLKNAATQISRGEAQLSRGRRELRNGEAQIANGEAQLADGHRQLSESYVEIETAKQEARGQIQDAMIDSLKKSGFEDEAAQTIVGSIGWVEPNYSPDLDDSSLRATDFQVTDTVSVDFAKDSEQVAKALVSPLEQVLTEEAYQTAASTVEQILDYVGYSTVSEQLQQWDDGHEQYLTGKAQLAAAKEELEEGQEKYRQGEEQLLSASEEYEAGLAQYNDGKTQYESGLAQYNEGLRRYEEGLAQYNEGKAKLEAGEAEYEAGVAQYETGLAEYLSGEEQYADGLAQYNDGAAEYEARLAEYNEAKAKYDEGVETYDASLAQYNDALARYQRGVADYQAGMRRYEDGEAQYTDGLAQYDDGMRQLIEGSETLAEKEREYADGMAQYNDGAAQLDEARETLDALSPARWVVLTPDANGGYLQLRTSCSSVKIIGARFTVLFLVVGALVIYATVAKIVDEQHKLVGATKAFGFFNREILAKYLIYGVSATAVGILLGAAASIPLQLFVASSFGKIFVFGSPRAAVRQDLMVLVLVLGVLLSLAAVWFACTTLMRSTAIRLMQDSTPVGGKKSGHGSKSLLTLYQRLILRNMRSDLKRITITVVSIMGCCALLVIGFTLRACVFETPSRQYGQIVQYDYDLSYEPGAEAEMEAVLERYGATETPAYRLYTSLRIGAATDFGELIVIDGDRLSELYRLSDKDTKDTLHVGSDGIYIFSGIAQSHGLSVGDTVVLMNESGTEAEARIAGVFRNYLGQMIFLTPAYYAEIFGEEPISNSMLGHLNGADFDALSGELSHLESFRSLERSDSLRALVESFTKIINAVVCILIVAAGAMAAVILTNLTNIYIRQKTRELAVMRVNGFTVREVIRYMLGETYVTTALGILLGCVVGSALGIWIVGSFQSPVFRFVAEPNATSCLISAAITLLFVAIINILALRKVKDLKLTDISG